MSRSERFKMVALMGILLHCATMRMLLVGALPSPAPALPVSEIPVGSVDDVKRLSGLKSGTSGDATIELGVAGGQHTLLEAATSQAEAAAHDDNLSYLFDGLMSSATRGMPAGMRRLDQVAPTGSGRPNSALHDLPNVNPGDFLRPETLMAAAAGNRQATASSARRRDQLADIVDNGAFNARSNQLEDGRYPSAELVAKLSNHNDNYNRLALASAMRFQQAQQRKQTGSNQRRQMAPVAGRRSSNGRVANRKQQQQRRPAKTQRRSGGRVGGRGRASSEEQRESTGSDEYDELDERSDSADSGEGGDDESEGDEAAGSRSERRAADSEREVFGELADGPEEENDGETKRSASGEGDELGDDEPVEPMVGQQRPRPRPQATAARSQRRQSTSGADGRRGNQQGRKMGTNSKRRAAAAAARQRGNMDESRNQLTTSARMNGDYAGNESGNDETNNQDEAASHVRQSTTDLQTAAGHHHGHHGHYYQYVEVPKKKTWKFGFKRGNHKHEIMKHEKGHKHKFHTEFKWHAKEKCKKKSKCKSVGKMTWDYKHHKHHHG